MASWTVARSVSAGDSGGIGLESSATLQLPAASHLATAALASSQRHSPVDCRLNLTATVPAAVMRQEGVSSRDGSPRTPHF